MRRFSAAHPHSGPAVKDATELRAWLERQEAQELSAVRENADPYGNQKSCVGFLKSTGKFKGTIERMSLGSLVAIEGELTKNQYVFKETAFIRHGNSLLNCIYTFDFKADARKAAGKIQGTWKNPDDGRGGRAELAPIKEPPDP